MADNYSIAARKIAGYLENGPEKQKTRHDLVDAARRHLPQVRTIFTLAGVEARCAALFRETWPECRIVSIDRSKAVIRARNRDPLYEAYQVGKFGDYVQRKLLWVPFDVRSKKSADGWSRDHSFRPMREFDWPKYDMAFLDFTGFVDRGREEETAFFIQDHMAERFVVGVTLNLHGLNVEPSIVANSIVRLAQPVPVAIDQITTFFSGTDMMFCILRSA